MTVDDVVRNGLAAARTALRRSETEPAHGASAALRRLLVARVNQLPWADQVAFDRWQREWRIPALDDPGLTFEQATLCRAYLSNRPSSSTAA